MITRIITQEEENIFSENETKIEIIPVWKWALWN